MDLQLWLMVPGLIVGGGAIFFLMARFGERLIKQNEEIEKAKEALDAERSLEGLDNLAVYD